MSKRNKLLNYRIMTIDCEGNTFCLYDSTLENPCSDQKALDELREIILKRVSNTASEIYNNDPDAFPIIN